MTKFLVGARVVEIQYIEVNAEDEEDAVEKVVAGQGRYDHSKTFVGYQSGGWSVDRNVVHPFEEGGNLVTVSEKLLRKYGVLEY